MASASQLYPALTLEVMVSRKEGQYYDVKSAQKKPSELSDIVSAYANAEGGTVVIGISDKTRRVEGVNAQGEEKINNFLNLPKESRTQRRYPPRVQRDERSRTPRAKDCGDCVQRDAYTL